MIVHIIKLVSYNFPILKRVKMSFEELFATSDSESGDMKHRHKTQSIFKCSVSMVNTLNQTQCRMCHT